MQKLYVGHPTLTLSDLRPSANKAFSPNLWSWMRAHTHFFADGGVHCGVWRVKANRSCASQAFGAGTLLLGAPYAEHERDTDFSGERLLAVLTQGTRARSYCWPGLAPYLEEVPDFWARYLRVGRCAIDPAHQMAFRGDRFTEEGDVRCCTWCGARQVRQLTPRVVHDVHWESLAVAEGR